MPDATRKPAKPPATYASAGVDLSQGDRTKQRIKYLAQKTFNKQVLGDIGGFGGLFRLDIAKYADPILVSSADGVGTKLKVAFAMGMHHTVGADLVNVAALAKGKPEIITIAARAYLDVIARTRAAAKA